MHSMKPYLLLAGGLVLGTLATACSTPLPPTQSAKVAALPDPGPTHQYHVKFPERGAARRATSPHARRGHGA